MNESSRRLAAVVHGPWEKEGTIARSFLSEQEAYFNDSVKGLAGGKLEKPHEAVYRLLVRMFRYHSTPVTSPKEIAIRESFDEALTPIQLLEISIECGYLSLSDAKVEAQSQFQSLVFAKPMKKFIADYDYFLVRFLAARIGYDLGLPPVEPPVPFEKGEARYSVLLGSHKQWYGDNNLDTWLGYLDDYEPMDLANLDEHYSQFLQTGSTGRLSDEHIAHLRAISNGMFRFFELLGALFSVANPNERRYWALLYCYWLAKTFGYEMEDGEYEKSDLDVGAVYEKALSSRGSSLAEQSGMSAQGLLEDYLVVKETWDEAREFVNSHIPNGSG